MFQPSATEPITGYTRSILQAVKAADQDFEWYPTTQAMIDAVARRLPKEFESIMDIGAGDGRVLLEFAKLKECTLYAIEKSSVLAATWPENIVPIGTEFFEQNLACLPVTYIFCNPPYSEYETWFTTIFETAYAKRAFLVIPQRWKDSPQLAAALKKRDAKTRVIYSGDFLDGERRARAVIDIVEITFPAEDGYGSDKKPHDPFDAWFDENFKTLDSEQAVTDEAIAADLSKRHNMDTITGLVDAFNEEYARMQDNYHAIFKLDSAILKELGVTKSAIGEGLKKRMAGLKTKYWQLLFDRLTAITSRLCADTKKKFLGKLTGRAGIAFTASNACVVVIWAIKNANKYFDEQLVTLFKALSAQDGVKKYKSNDKVWIQDRWRFRNEENYTHYALDYRFVVPGYSAICNESYKWDFPNGLHKDRHDIIGDTIAVLGNLGFNNQSLSSMHRQWRANEWQDFFDHNGDTLVQVKAFKNGNVHYRFKPEAIRALNVEAGRLLGWLRSPADVVTELGYDIEEAEKLFMSSQKILPSNIKLLTCG